MSKIRLLFVVHSLSIGGTEKLVTQISSALSPQQYTIGICCLDSKGTLWSECEEKGYQLFELGRQPGWQWQTFKNAAKAITQFKPDVIHAHQYTPYVYSVAGKILSRSKSKILFTEHGRHFPDIVSRKRRIANFLLRGFANRITAVSEFSRKALEEKEGFSSQKIDVIYNGLASSESSDKEISLHQELKLDASTPLIGYVGSLREVKNPCYLLEMFVELSRTEKSSHLVFIGEGPLREKLEAIVNNNNLGHRVSFLGARNPATPYLSSLTVFALPSLSEAASLALLEAMSRGVASVATNTGGTPELLSDGQTGILVPTNNAEEFAKEVELLLKQPKRREYLGVEAKKDVNKRFSFEKMLDNYCELYEDLR